MVDKGDISRALQQRGPIREVIDVADKINAMECFEKIPWEPELLFEVGDELWGLEVVLASYPRTRQLEVMRRAQEECENFRSAVVVQDAEDAAEVIVRCRPYGIYVLHRVGGRYETREPMGQPAAVAKAPAAPSRIPPTLADRAGGVQNVNAGFGAVLGEFADQHRAQRESGRMSDAEEAGLLKRTFERLIASNAAFEGNYGPLEILQKIEEWSTAGGFRDHYFHTFQNFLLGMVVVDEAHEHFRECMLEIMPGMGNEVSLEYIWLLAALFHDVGYSVQRRDEVVRSLYGSPIWGAEGEPSVSEEAIAERKQWWDSDSYRTVRCQLVSLYDHLVQECIGEDWAFEPFPTSTFQVHAFDRAAAENFVVDGHGIAGALHLAVDLGQTIRGLPDGADRRYLSRHLFLAALSIPTHDSRFRRSLREYGITKIHTRRFPFAALLAFIDSIQDDRREGPVADSSVDVLQNLRVEGLVVRAEIDIAALPEDKLSEKQVEARDLRDFLDTEGGLEYAYPTEYLGETER